MMRWRLNEISIWVMWIVIALGVNFGLVAFAWVWNPPQLPIVEFNSPAATTVILTAVKQPVTLEVVMLPRPKDPIVVPVAYEGESKAERDKLFQATDKVIIDTTGRGVISLNFFPKAPYRALQKPHKIVVVLKASPAYRLGTFTRRTLEIACELPEPLVQFGSQEVIKVKQGADAQVVPLEVTMSPPPKAPLEVPVAYEGETPPERDKVFQGKDKVIIDTTGRGVISVKLLPKRSDPESLKPHRFSVVLQRGAGYGLGSVSTRTLEVACDPLEPLVQFNSLEAVKVRQDAVEQVVPLPLEVMMLSTSAAFLEVRVAYEGESQRDRDRMFKAPDKVTIGYSGRTNLNLTVMAKAGNASAARVHTFYVVLKPDRGYSVGLFSRRTLEITEPVATDVPPDENRPALPVVEFTAPLEATKVVELSTVKQSVTLEATMTPPPKTPVEVLVSYEGDAMPGKIFTGPDKIAIDSTGHGVITVDFFPISPDADSSLAHTLSAVLKKDPAYSLGLSAKRTFIIKPQPPPPPPSDKPIVVEADPADLQVKEGETLKLTAHFKDANATAGERFTIPVRFEFVQPTGGAFTAHESHLAGKLPAEFQFEKLQNSASLALMPKADAIYEGNETFGITFLPPRGYCIDAPRGTLVVTIVDMDPPPQVYFVDGGKSSTIGWMNGNDSMEFRVRARNSYKRDQLPITVAFGAEGSKPPDALATDRIAQEGVDFELESKKSDFDEFGNAVVKIKLLGADDGHPNRNKGRQPNKWFRLKIVSVTPQFVKPIVDKSQIDVKIEDDR